MGKCLSTKARNLCPMLVLTFLLKGGLYQEYVALAVFSFARCGGFVLKGVVIFAFVESLLVWRGGLVEGRFVGRQG